MFEPTATTRFAASCGSSVDPKLEGTPSFNNFDPLLRETLAALDLLGTEVDVDFKVPATAQGGFYAEFADKWSTTADVVWLNMCEFGITRVSVGQESITVRDDKGMTKVVMTFAALCPFVPVKLRFLNQREHHTPDLPRAVTERGRGSSLPATCCKRTIATLSGNRPIGAAHCKVL